MSEMTKPSDCTPWVEKVVAHGRIKRITFRPITGLSGAKVATISSLHQNIFRFFKGRARSMITRRYFTTAGASAGALAALAHSAFAQVNQHDHDHAVGVNEEMAHCAIACNDCQRECDSCATHCADSMKEGKTGHYDTLMTCQDCAEICSAAARSCSRGGPFATIICKACAECCAMCAAACEKFADDGHMKRCADECRKCEKACREMA
jgi:hypothetical protein